MIVWILISKPDQSIADKTQGIVSLKFFEKTVQHFF